MIISHKHKFIFIKTRKTGGTSFETVLASICGPDDVITEISEEQARKDTYGISAQNVDIPFWKYTVKDWGRLIFKGERKKFHSHMPAFEIRKYLEKKKWEGYYKFCIDRNPWEKTISHFYWCGGFEKYDNVLSFLNSEEALKTSNYKLYATEKGLLVNEVFRYEELDHCIAFLERFLKTKFNIALRDVKFKGRNAPRKKYTEILTDEEGLRIKQIHQKELEILDYQY